MMTPLPPKTPATMRRAAELRGQPQPTARPPAKIDPADLPLLAAETPRELDAATGRLARVQARPRRPHRGEMTRSCPHTPAASRARARARRTVNFGNFRGSRSCPVLPPLA